MNRNPLLIYNEVRSELSTYLKQNQNINLPKGKFNDINKELYKKVKQGGSTGKKGIMGVIEGFFVNRDSEPFFPFRASESAPYFEWLYDYIQEKDPAILEANDNIIIDINTIYPGEYSYKDISYYEHFRENFQHFNQENEDGSLTDFHYCFIQPLDVQTNPDNYTVYNKDNPVVFNRKTQKYETEFTICNGSGEIWDNEGNRITWGYDSAGVYYRTLQEYKAQIKEPFEEIEQPEIKEIEGEKEEKEYKRNQDKIENKKEQRDSLMQQKSGIIKEVELELMDKKEAKEKLKKLNENIEKLNDEIDVLIDKY